MCANICIISLLKFIYYYHGIVINAKISKSEKLKLFFVLKKSKFERQKKKRKREQFMLIIYN